MEEPAEQITELIGVYDAKGTITGELAYWVGARLGRAHCALCDITHGLLREKSEWRSCRAGLPIPFATVHLDEQSPDLAALTAGTVPCVAARTATDLRILLGPADLSACAGVPSNLVAAVEAAVDRAGLRLGPPT